MSTVFEDFNEGVTASLDAHQRRADGMFDDAKSFDLKAVDCFDRVLATEPKHVGALGGKAMSLTQLGQTADAVLAFEAALEIDPIPEFYRQLGLCQVELGDMEKAWVVTRKAVAGDGTPEFRRNAARELVGFGKHILQIINVNFESMNQEQIVAYHRWAASTFALASETDPSFEDAQSSLSLVEKKLDGFSNQ